MSTIQVCRTCLAHKNRMYNIANTPVQKYYEDITKIPLNTQDGRPSFVCYICYHLLKKCHRFAESAVQADEVLQQICKNVPESQITEQHITMIEKSFLSTFSRTPVNQVNTSAVSENIEIPLVKYEKFEIKTENEQENMAMAATEFTEDRYQTYQALDDPLHFEIKIEKIELEDTQYHHRCSGSDVEPLQSIRKTFRDTSSFGSDQGVQASGERLPRKCRQGVPLPTKLKLEHHESPEIERKYIKQAMVQHCDTKRSYLNEEINFENEDVQTFSPSDEIDEKQCNYCGKRFPYKSILTRHLRMHTGEKPFPCNYCDKKFTLVNGLTQHVKRMHTGEKPYTCDLCGKNFLQKSILSTHLRVHTGDKPFTCNYCGKSYALKLKLKHHLRMHTGERPFSCNLCDLKFTEKYLLTRHLRRHQ